MYADFHQDGKLPEYSVLSFKNKKMPQKKVATFRSSSRRNSYNFV